jgi:hypothetical protein
MRVKPSTQSRKDAKKNNNELPDSAFGLFRVHVYDGRAVREAV